MLTIQRFLSLVFSTAVAVTATAEAIAPSPVQANFLKTGQSLTQQLSRPEVKLQLTAYKRLLQPSADGQANVSWKDLGRQAVVQPGDVLRYQLTSRNVGDAAARNLILNQPIPAQMTYLLGSAENNAGLVTTYSIDNGKSFSAQPMISVKQEDGSMIQQPAPAEIYSHVRWQAQGELPPATDVMVSYQVTVR